MGRLVVLTSTGSDADEAVGGSMSGGEDEDGGGAIGVETVARLTTNR